MRPVQSICCNEVNAKKKSIIIVCFFSQMCPELSVTVCLYIFIFIMFIYIYYVVCLRCCVKIVNADGDLKVTVKAQQSAVKLDFWCVTSIVRLAPLFATLQTIYFKLSLCITVLNNFVAVPVILTYRVMRQLTSLLNRQRVKISLDRSLHTWYTYKEDSQFSSTMGQCTTA